MKYVHKTKGTCSTQIDIETEGGIIRSVQFKKGCQGNASGISALLPGMKVEDAIQRLKGIECRNGTSCPDQLSIALEHMQKNEAEATS